MASTRYNLCGTDEYEFNTNINQLHCDGKNKAIDHELASIFIVLFTKMHNGKGEKWLKILRLLVTRDIPTQLDALTTKFFKSTS